MAGKNTPITATEPAKLVGQLTDKEITALKATHKGGVYGLTDGKCISYFKNPTRQEVNCALSKAEADKPLATIEDMMELTFVAGSELWRTDDQIALGFMNAVKDKMSGTVVFMVNL